MNVYRRLFPYLRRHLSRFVLSTFCMIGFVFFNISSVALVMPFVDTIFSPSATDPPEPAGISFGLTNLKGILTQWLNEFIYQHDRLDVLLWICLLILATFILKNLFGLARAFLMATVEQGMMADLRIVLYSHLHALSLGYFTEERKGNLISRVTNDVRIINESVIAVINSIFRDPPQIIAYAVILFLFNWELTILVALVIPITGFIAGKIGDALKRASISSQEKMADITSILDETLSGIRIVKAFGMERFEIAKFSEETGRFQKIMETIVRRRSLGGPISEVLGITSVTLILWFMGQAILRGESDMTPGGFVFYVSMIYQLIQPLKMFTQLFNSYHEGIAAAGRVFGILDEKPSIVDAPNAIGVGEFSRTIEYDSVSFQYREGRTVLRNVSFTINFGEIVAVVGPSGSGKSTLVDLLPRFYDVTSGAIRIDGNDIRQISIRSLRGLIGVVTQETILFNDTVRNNIGYGHPEIPQSRLVEAAKAANAHDFIMKLPGGYDSRIGDRGVKLSGGERQRLSIARAIVKNPPILILDEATSALDTESEILVQEAIIQLMKGRTSIVIAHRLSTIQHADNIIVIEDGSVRETGQHSVLLNDDSSLYKRLYHMQFRV